jgi:hypothetical protein
MTNLKAGSNPDLDGVTFASVALGAKSGHRGLCRWSVKRTEPGRRTRRMPFVAPGCPPAVPNSEHEGSALQVRRSGVTARR